ncbi:hypothetical protein L21SP2_0366 [Salinispira pacifica]|uniref:Uncharacterized protein n=1 Tax=Salinispira pacifica TaxID=1307761 RepID=V5WDD4_9SPIO|nr:hypothetical protein L21SP2_0366 [Salinispira pacifica]
MNQIFLWHKSCSFCFAGRISAMYGKQVMRALCVLRNGVVARKKGILETNAL